ncbi:hypothetical protein MPR_2617 [Myroides profundi]|nr:hypothetical protein MPR_2617 [Myroides profundi]
MSKVQKTAKNKQNNDNQQLNTKHHAKKMIAFFKILVV